MAGIGEMFPFVCVAAAFAEGQSVIRGAGFLRERKTDQMSAVVKNLRAMKVKFGELEDGLVIEGASEYDGVEFDSFGDPAVAMAFAVAGTKNLGQSRLHNAEAVDEVWPDFYAQLEKMTQTA